MQHNNFKKYQKIIKLSNKEIAIQIFNKKQKRVKIPKTKITKILLIKILLIIVKLIHNNLIYFNLYKINKIFKTNK